jgi:hypothetical protein
LTHIHNLSTGERPVEVRTSITVRLRLNVSAVSAYKPLAENPIVAAMVSEVHNKHRVRSSPGVRAAGI